MSRTYSISKLPQDYQEIIDVFPQHAVRKSWRIAVLKSINEILDSQSLVLSKSRMVKVAKQSSDGLFHFDSDDSYPPKSLEKCREDLKWSREELIKSVEGHETIMSMLFDAVGKQLNHFKSRFEKERDSYFVEVVDALHL